MKDGRIFKIGSLKIIAIAIILEILCVLLWFSQFLKFKKFLYMNILHVGVSTHSYRNYKVLGALELELQMLVSGRWWESLSGSLEEELVICWVIFQALFLFFQSKVFCCLNMPLNCHATEMGLELLILLLTLC